MGFLSTTLNWDIDWPGHTVTGYDVFIDGVHRDRVAGSSYFIRDLQENQFYTLSVQPYDGSGPGPLHVSYFVPTSPGNYVLPADRMTKWNPGLNSVGGIPSADWPIYTTIAPSGGDDTATIQTALDNCPPYHVVKLTAGTFNITGQGLQILRSHVVLRGAGPGLANFLQSTRTTDGSGTGTYLVKPLGTNYPVVIIGPRWGGDTGLGPFRLTSDAIKGYYSVDVQNATGLAAGDLISLNSLTDPEVSHWNSTDPENMSGWFSRPDRPLGQTMEVESVNGNTVTFTTPFHITFKVSRSAEFYTFATPTAYSGIEELYAYGGEGGDGGGGFHLFASKYCWVKHCESTWTAGGSIHIDMSLRCEIRDSFFHDSYAGLHSGGSSYGIGFQWYTSDTLVENCISTGFNKCMVMRCSGGGNVIAYNYMDNGADLGGFWFEDVLTASHMTTPHYELLEGNCAANFDQDDRWGNSVYITVFRNYLLGTLRDYANTGPWRAAGVCQWHWWHNFVGNILCAPGHPHITQYESLDASVPSVWMWCYHSGDALTDGGKALATNLRDGNFDYYTYGTRWHGIGGTGVDNGLTRPANWKLPDSLYLKGKPAFFGRETWPYTEATDPTRPIRGQLPARLRYDFSFPNDLSIV